MLQNTIDAIEPLDATAMEEAVERQAQLAKPAGSLGVLEEVSVALCGIQASCPPTRLARPVVAVFAGDHGVHAQGVSPWPQEVTSAMIGNFLTGGAAVNVLARKAGADVYVVDMGVAGDLPDHDAQTSDAQTSDVVTRDAVTSDVVIDHKIRRGTWDLATGPAMTRVEAVRGLNAGISVAHALAEQGYDCFLTGDMGIANTTASAALISALAGVEPHVATGRGTGIDDPTLALKIEVVRAALAQRPAGDDPVELLASVGGFEHAGIAGLILAAAALRIPVILDGVVAGSAALVAQALAPTAARYCFAGHRSVEPGHVIALDRLGLRPLVDLDLRLGEGTGAALAFPLVEAAGATLREMATFDSAGVVKKQGVGS